ncbi:MAG: glycolate oxidase subunit GlcE [Aestuariivirgaceae bacterium]
MATVEPRNAAEAAEAIKEAAAQGRSFDIAGSGSKRCIGRPAEASDRLDVSHLAGIVGYEAEELILTVNAGTPVSQIHDTLRQRQQMLAFEPPDFTRLLGTGSGTIGGIFAANLSGPRRIKSGAARDFILGFSGVNGRGEIFQAGGRVVKNVTGYDLPKLLCGSWGTLAVLSEITLKVMPAPETEVSVSLSGLDHDAAVNAMSAALQSSTEVSAAAFLPEILRFGGGSVSQTLLRLEGIEASVETRAAMLKSVLRQFGDPFVLDQQSSQPAWAAIRDAAALETYGDHIIWRVSVPPSSSGAVTRTISEAVDAKYFCDWGGGLIWLAVPASADGHEGTIRGAFKSFGGHATLVRAPESLRQSVAVFEPQPPGLAALTRRVKTSFDPKRVLNPSRMYEGV